MALVRPACTCPKGDSYRDYLHYYDCNVKVAYRARCTCPGLVDDELPHLHRGDCPNYDPTTRPGYVPGRGYWDAQKVLADGTTSDKHRGHGCSEDPDKFVFNQAMNNTPGIIQSPVEEHKTMSTERVDAQQILADAEAIIAPSGERGETYGNASENFDRIATLWGPILGINTITAEQVALCMNQVKVSRLIETPNHRDSWLDGAAYLALGGAIAMTPDRYV